MSALTSLAVVAMLLLTAAAIAALIHNVGQVREQRNAQRSMGHVVAKRIHKEFLK